MLPHKRAAELAQMTLPTDAEMVRRTRTYMMTSGLTTSEMSEAIGMAPSTLRVWLSGRYGNQGTVKTEEGRERTTRNLRAALKQYLDLHEVVDPVRLEKPHKTADYVALRKAAYKALQNGSAYVVDGPPGTQKTFSLRAIEHEINATGAGHAVYVYARDGHAPQSFLQEVCIEAGLPSRGSIDQLLRKLGHFLGRKRVLLIVDEAQHLPPVTLETLRKLLDNPPYFGVILAGSHDVSLTLRALRMQQWHDRARKTFLLNGPSEAEARDILRQEIPGLPERGVADIVGRCCRDAVRDGQKFSYISARLLFFAIQDFRDEIAARKPNGSCADGERLKAAPSTSNTNSRKELVV